MNGLAFLFGNIVVIVVLCLESEHDLLALLVQAHCSICALGEKSYTDTQYVYLAILDVFISTWRKNWEKR